jgi:hypothetical protein
VPSDHQARFRITVWPATRLPIPRYTRREAYYLSRTGSALIGSPESVEVTPGTGDAYLDLYGLDLDDPAAIVGYANKYGAFFDVKWVVNRLTSLDVYPAAYSADEEWNEIARTYDSDPRLNPVNADEDGLFVGTLDGFRHAARCVRDLTRAWRMVRGDIDADLSAFETFRVRLRGGDDYTNAKAILFRGLNDLLSEMQPSIGDGPANPDPDPEYDHPRWPPEEGEQPAAPEGSGTPHGKLRVTERRSPVVSGLAEICALELFNHIVAGEVYRTCKNENCGSLFVHQYGRAKHGQSKREGVLYCTPACARATASREYRRRKSRARRECTPGSDR